MTTDDLYHRAATLAARRAWLAAARVAPIPDPPAPPYAPLRPDAHEAAVAAALARGTSTLQQWKDNGMPRIQLQTGRQTPATPAASPRVTCVVCQLFAPRALAGHAVCAPCAERPDAARSILASRSARALAAVLPAQAELDAAYTALTDGERARWQAICQARIAVGRAGRWQGTADAATREKLQRTKDAIDRNDPRISEGLRRIWHADEALFWANEVAADEGRRVAVAGEQLEACLAALGQQTMEAA